MSNAKPLGFRCVCGRQTGKVVYQCDEIKKPTFKQRMDFRGDRTEIGLEIRGLRAAKNYLEIMYYFGPIIDIAASVFLDAL